MRLLFVIALGWIVFTFSVSAQVFLHRATLDNISGNSTYLDYPGLNESPTAILLVTSNYNPDLVGGVYHTPTIGVWYDRSTSSWAIFNQDRSPMTAGAAFNVQYLTFSQSAFVYTIPATALRGAAGVIDHPALNDRPDALVSMTMLWNPAGRNGVYNPHPMGLRYEPSLGRWLIENLDDAPMPANASFNLSVDGAISLMATADNTTSNSVYLSMADAGLTDNAILIATPTSSGTRGSIGVWYDQGRHQWAVFNQDRSLMQIGSRFTVRVAGSMIRNASSANSAGEMTTLSPGSVGVVSQVLNRPDTDASRIDPSTTPTITCEDNLTSEDSTANWDFELGLRGWKRDVELNSAFARQPTFGRNILNTRRSPDAQAPPSLGGDYWIHAWEDFETGTYGVGHHGEYWIGTYENRPLPESPAGGFRGDAAIGALVSSQFVVDSRYLSFLVGGGSNNSEVGVDLQVLAVDYAELLNKDGATKGRPPLENLQRSGCYVVYKTAAGQNRETMQRVIWDLEPLFPRSRATGDRLLRARIMIRDYATDSWGHINADDFRFSDNLPPPAPGIEVPLFGFADTHTHPVANLGAGGLYHGSVGGNWRTTNIAEDLRSDDGYGHGGATLTAQLVSTALEPKALPYFLARLDPVTPILCSSILPILPIPAAAVTAGDAVTGYLSSDNPVSLLPPLSIWLTEAPGLSLQPCAYPLAAEVFQHYGDGYPNFIGWPRWDTTIHQSMHISWIRRAYEGGLRLMSTLTLSPKLFEYVMKSAGERLISDREHIEKQVEEINRIVAVNSDWMEIAKTPEDAQRIITQNKLAIILGTEMDDMGRLGFPSAEAEVAWLYDLGIRQITPIHFADNPIGSPAVYNDLFNTLNEFVNRPFPRPGYDGWYQVEEGCPAPGEDCIQFRLKPDQAQAWDANLFGNPATRAPFVRAVHVSSYDMDRNGDRNAGHLTDFGSEYLRAMMRRGMIIAVDHMGEKTLEAALGLAERNDYPVLSDHTGFRALALRSDESHDHSKWPHESMKKNSDVQRIQRLGGMIAPITVPEDQRSYNGSLPYRIDNNSAGSSKSWAQSYLLAVELMGQNSYVALGTDYGFLAKPAPRFGTDSSAGFGSIDSIRDVNGHNLTRKNEATMQLNGVKYDTPIREYRYHRFRSTEVYNQEERDVWEAIAAYKAGVAPDRMEGPRTLVERTVFQQNKIVNLARGLWVTDTDSEEATGRHGLILPGDNSFYERRAAYLVKTRPQFEIELPTSIPDDEIRRLYRLMKPIWNTWLSMETGLGTSQPVLLRSVTGNRDFDYNIDGFAHYGMLPDFLQDLYNVGLNDIDPISRVRRPGYSVLSPLLRSAEGYVRMWQKANERALTFVGGPRP